MTELMNALVLTGYGGPEKLIYTKVPKPVPLQGEVLIKVGACSVNNTDLNTRTGWYTASESFESILQDMKKNDVDTSTSWQQAGIQFPRIQGADIAGKVVEISDDVNPELLNQRVIVDPWIRSDKLEEYQYIGSEIDGGFAEYAVVPASNIYPINSSLSDVELATFPCAYSTAENLLTKGRVSAEDTVLIMGASGGVG
ncbi:MAG: alcohol dehydrogenase catalytic domain-containing protein, partial [Scytonema sp. PMC 1069.18]|nr:alcohol dehydrogenase catalytic domain-containing protein [Scytonema sp. PMC 1069.18]